jgi:hypothetical protein
MWGRFVKKISPAFLESAPLAFLKIVKEGLVLLSFLQANLAKWIINVHWANAMKVFVNAKLNAEARASLNAESALWMVKSAMMTQCACLVGAVGSGMVQEFVMVALNISTKIPLDSVMIGFQVQSVSTDLVELILI